MTKQDIIDYVMHTPGNTNKAILNSMLNQIKSEDDDNSLTFSKVSVEIINNADISCDVDLFLQPMGDYEPINYVSAFILDVNMGITLGDYPITISVDSGNSTTNEFYLMPDKSFCAILISDIDSNLVGIGEGHIEETYISEGGETYSVFIITGDCTIIVSNKE